MDQLAHFLHSILWEISVLCIDEVNRLLESRGFSGKKFGIKVIMESDPKGSIQGNKKLTTSTAKQRTYNKKDNAARQQIHGQSKILEAAKTPGSPRSSSILLLATTRTSTNDRKRYMLTKHVNLEVLMSAVIGVRVPKKLKKELEKLGIDYASEVRAYLEKRVREEKTRRALEEIKRIRKQIGWIDEDLAASLVREDRETR